MNVNKHQIDKLKRAMVSLIAANSLIRELLTQVPYKKIEHLLVRQKLDDYEVSCEAGKVALLDLMTQYSKDLQRRRRNRRRNRVA